MTRKQSGEKEKKGKIKVLSLNKETVKDLTEKEAKGVKGGTTQCIGSVVRGTTPNNSYSSVIRQTSGSLNSTGGFNP